MCGRLICNEVNFTNLCDPFSLTLLEVPSTHAHTPGASLPV